MFCTNCGIKSEPNVRFCGSCGCESVQVNSQQSAPYGESLGDNSPYTQQSPYGSPYTQQPPYAQQPPYTQQFDESKSRGKAIAALVLGIIAMTVPIPFLDVIAGVIGIYLAVTAKREGFRGGLQTAAFVLSIIGTVIAVIFTIGCMTGAAVFETMF